MNKLVACGYCDRERRTGLHVDRYRITQAGQEAAAV
jgi:DNA-binding PadR family transcriptional regulator